MGNIASTTINYAKEIYSRKVGSEPKNTPVPGSGRLVSPARSFSGTGPYRRHCKTSRHTHTHMHARPRIMTSSYDTQVASKLL